MLRLLARNARIATLTPSRFVSVLAARTPPVFSNHCKHIRLNSSAQFKPENQQLMIAFTCKKCDTRSSHTFSKQAYTHGSVLIQCPGCKGRHLISDNLGMFRDEKVNLEMLLKAKGESVATGTEDLVFEDIPESLRSTLGHYAKDAPPSYQESGLAADESPALPPVDPKK